LENRAAPAVFARVKMERFLTWASAGLLLAAVMLIPTAELQREEPRPRYVRLYSNGRNVDDANHLIEVEVYGR